ncbi:MAG: hypothetical protein ACXAB7_06045 [Candidatus Kariarchaeaceae archaeon]
MKIGKILNRLMNSLVSNRYDEYEEEIDRAFDIFLSPTEIEPLTLNNILLVTDDKPHSLISIAYAIRFASGLNCPLIAIANEKYKTIIKEEVERFQLEYTEVLEGQKALLEQIHDITETNEISFIVVPMFHPMRGDIIHHMHIPVLVTKVNPFAKPEKIIDQ